ncbi:MAG TPA: sugar ABC transporter ATP-binding protein [Chthoniobacterales bacterium]|nr:sugar ABC transporter ATP-binding protein [Chthoniobacterales bacterium]
MSGEHILKLRAITKDYPGVRAVDQVDFDLRHGEVHAVVGENGAGKSTLMNILGGVLAPDSGDIFLEDRPVRFLNAADAGRHGIGVVFQELSLVPSLSVAENVYFNRQPIDRIGFVASRRLHNATRQLLTLFNLNINPAKEVAELSMGHRQIIEVLKAISLRPTILILDEPTSSLSATEIDRLFDNIRRLKSEGVSFIYISHHLPEIFQIADRVTVLRDGKNAGTFNIAEVNEESLVKRMVGRELTNMYGRGANQIEDTYFQVERADSKTTVASKLRLVLRKGEILGIAGLIGSGRSELAMDIVGITPNRRCTVLLNGRRFQFRHPAEAIKQGVVYLTENRKELGLYLSMSMQDNCVAPTLRTYANRLGFISDRQINSAGLDARQRFNIATPNVRKLVGELSGGNQQKVLLAMWTGTRPRVLIVDEPTRGVDIGAKAEIYKLLRGLAASGIGIVMISSELQEILGMSDRIAVMRNHRFVAEFSRENASEETLILAAAGLAPEAQEVSGEQL